MGRSKFPGKPSKHVNRTRVNVLPPLTSTTVGENKLVLNSENEAEDQQKEIGVNDGNESEPSTSQVDTSGSLRTNTLSRAKRKCITARSNSVSKARLCRENIGIKRNKVSVKNLNEISLPKRGVRRSVQGFSNLRRLNRSNSLKENSNLVGKFVLPSRSVHSSRVIKPNKRFINVESVNRIEVRSLKKRAVNRRNNVKQTEERKVKTKLGDQSNQGIASNQNSSSMPCTNRRIILRQARLQLNNSTPSGTEGPFSSHSSSGSPPGTITCGVCGAVRFYRFIKQARKFNIYSCESCRKFISKIIKRQTCSKNSSISTLVCHKGQGKCHVPPIVRSQQWNLIHCAYRARCPACWLKMCLRSFQMPQNLKNSLYKLLPVNMRRPDTNLFNNSVSLFSWQNNCGNDVKTLNPLDIPQNAVKQRPIRIKQPKPDVNTTIIPSSDIKRQKIDLKGPRVKHVCRSASIVLGQPIATFQSEVDKNDAEIPDNQNKSQQIEADSQVCRKDISSARTLSGLEKIIEEVKVNDVEQLAAVKSSSGKPETSTTSRKEKSKNSNQTSCNIQLESKMPPITKKNLLESAVGGVCIDFWESYDPEEVCRNGFNLIASEPFPMQSICFLCGSAGREPLLYCSLCCEPYHSFCLEQDPQLLGGSIQYNWLCPRCTTCHACGQPDKQKVNCQKCHKTYHPECFNSKWVTDDKPTVCLSCLRCKSCGTNNITKFIGNLPLCVMCFKLRKKGNYCPLCQKCYDDNDFDTKMMECAKCNKWVHAKCEGLSDENYQILSLLPESVEFLCKICSNNTTPYWRKAIESELRTSFNNVLRLLSKNRIAREMLKWSPLCSNLVNSKTASAARKLQFSDDDGADDSNDHDDFSDKSEKSTSYSETVSFIEDEILKTGQRKKQNQKEIEIISLRMDQVSNRAPHTPSMTDIKNKLNSNEIYSISEFNKKMNDVLNAANSGKLFEIYRSILKTIFPWYDPEMFGIEESNVTVQEEPVVEISKSENVLQMWSNEKLNIKQNFDSEKFDTRSCAFCKGVGDGLSHQEARLLYCGQNEWVHANCALWSSEVYEEIDGSLQNVHSALSRGRSIRCTYCKLKGASIGCCAKSCYETFHFSCARTMKCNFMHDKTVYCPSHDLPLNSTVISSLADFDIRRSVYIELDKKKKKLVDPEKVHTIVGSLTITSLGKIIPVLSDTPDAIIPTGFVCSRLFWSTVEPWKLVPYVIKTSVLNSQINSIIVDKNFTVNHSLPKSVVEKKLKEILVWQKELEKEKIDTVDLEDEDEPQNATDILSPELTDAILEELPRDLLDGISMQDIFPKFVSYEEFVNVDFKNPDTQNSNDGIKIDTVNNLNKISEIDEKEQLQDDFCELKNRELKRSKSEVFSQLGVEKVSKSRSQQRSCSLTWSCKLDTSLSPLVKKRKMVPRDKNVFFQLLQVDGAYDSSSASECGSPRRETEDLWSPNICDEPVKCQRCQCTYRTQASYKRHLESCEIMSTSDSDSETVHEQDFNSSEQSIQAVADAVASITDVTTNDDTDVELKVGEVTRTYGMNSYEEFSAYQLNESNESKTQSTIVADTSVLPSTSNHAEILFPNVLQPTTVQGKSVQNFYTVPTQNFNQVVSTPQTQAVTLNQTSNPSFFDGHQTVSINSNHSSSITQATTIPLNQITTVPLTTQTTPICINQSNTVPLCLNQTSNTAGSISVVQSSPIAVSHPTPITLNQPGVISIGQQSIPLNSNPSSIQINPPIEIQSQQVTIQSVPMNQDVNQVLNPITIDTKMLATPSGIVPGQWMKTIPKTVPVPKPIRAKCRPRTLAAKRAKIPPGSTIVLPQTSSGPQVIVQHIASPNMMPTFLETFQHQTGQNLQYVATISPQITPAVNSQPQIVQLQSDNNIVGLVPGLQQPTMIIQQPRVVTDQLIIDQNGSVMWASQPVQPVYYGFETIVQNTVMQSQQFLPTTVPGILTANSSYSSTTQVFQTSKLEPILDVSSGSFVVLNPNTVINNGQSLPVAQIPQAPPPQPIQNNIQSQQVSIRPPVPPEIKINIAKPVEVTTQAVPVTTLKSTVTTTTTTITTTTHAHSTSSNTYNSITLPVAPFVPEQRIPTNIVTPTPKVSTSNQNRPMSRVLPMQTTSVRDTKKLVDKPREIMIKTEQPTNISEEILKVKKNIIVEDELVKPRTKEIMIQTVETLNKREAIPLSIKPTFEKAKEEPQQRKENTNQKNYSVQIISLKPMKPKTASQNPTLSSISISPTKPITAFAETSFTSTKDTRDPGTPKNYVNKPPVVVKSEPKVHNEKVETSSNPGILYTVETRDGFRYSSNSVSDLWSKVFEAVQAARIAHNMAPLPSNGLNLINNLQLLGLKANSLRYLLEQLPGASKCVKYKPNFNFNAVHSSADDDILIGQSYGAIRCAPYNKRHETNDMFGWLASKHRKLEDHTTLNEIQPRRSSITNLPMAMRFRQLRLSSKVSVGVYRSSIHRRGLFCLRDIESGEMVIEYAGEVIRSVLTDKREKYYNSKGIGCYMFRIDDNLVVDATMKGNAARFINHSCDPNCYSKVVEILGHKHIIIFALRKIFCGEELTYDYKFPFEEDKIPCTCGARRCRKFLN